MSLRRGRGGGGGGFGSGNMTRSESYRAEDEDEGLDRDLAETVRDRAPSPPSAPAPEPDENRRRLAEATMAGDAAYAKEFRLSLLHKLLMRGISLDNIARELGVSLSTVKNDRVALKKRLREAAKELDINELIGGQQALYDEITALSMRISSSTGTPTAMRMAGMRTALAANADRTRFLSSAGVFDVLSFRKAEDGTDLSDVQQLMQRTNEVLERVLSEAEEESPSPRRRNRVVRPGGFSRLTFDDGPSPDDAEVIDL